jgi:hypothetical protein
MARETAALARLCENFQDYSHYKRVRFYIIGLQAWLISYLVKMAAQPNGTQAGSADSMSPAFLFDFSGVKDGPTRLQSKACYARLPETVGRSYLQFAAAGRFDPNPIAARIFNRKNKRGEVQDDEFDFAFLEQQFSDMGVRIGFAQPRASRVPEKHFELQPDTLRVLMLSLLPAKRSEAITVDKVYTGLIETWGIVVGGNPDDIGRLRAQGYFGLDEQDLHSNAVAFVERLKILNLAVEPSDGLVLCATDVGGIL